MPLVSDQLRYLAEDHPDAVGYRVIGRGELTNAQWSAQASRVARGLLERGLARHGRVALALEPADALENLAAYMGVHKAGGATVPTNIRLSPDELRVIFDTAEPTVVIASASLLDRLAPAIAVTDSLVHVVVVGDAADAEAARERVAGAANVVAWDDFLADDDSDLQVDLSDDDVADILFTSGTTGRPKGVVARHNRATSVEIGRTENHTGLLWLHASPLFTFAGVSFITVPLRLGMTGLYLPRFDAGSWLEIVERDPVVMGFLVPSMVELMIQHDDFGTRDLSGLMMAAIGSAPIAPATLRRFHGALPNATVSNSYSMTEAGQAYCVMPPEEFHRREGSVGLPVPPLEIRILDEEGIEVGPDEVGEIELRNAGKQREYWNNPEATAEAWTEDGWLRTGDLGRRDADGFLYIMGRKKDVIIRGGNNIHAKDIEDVLYTMPGVQEAAVVGIPHQVLGEDVAAAIVPAPDATLTPDDVLAFVADKLADYKVPRRVAIVAQLPRNPMGKVLKHVLSAQLAPTDDA